MSAPILAALAVISTVSQGDQRYTLEIPAGPLAASLARLSEATGVDVGTTGLGLEGVMTPPVVGRLTVAQALERMLRGHNLRARHISTSGWRLEPYAPSRPRAASPPQPPAADILVLASKRATPLTGFAGAANVMSAIDLDANTEPVGTDAVIERSTALTSTARGVGRNKLFIRGIADSSFTGTSQTTTGQYLDETRLTYNTPDPGLILYDVRSVEVLEGPQGTLYGTGALGGVVRITTQPPNPDKFAGAVAAGATLTAHGSPGGDISGFANLPLVEDRLALRAVGYAVSDGGYIDDASHQRRNINRVITRGGRLALRWKPDADWTVDIRGVGQNIDGRDSQWADRSAQPLVRTAQLPQPYHSHFLLGDATIFHELGAVRLVSTTSVTRQELVENYDASNVLLLDDLSTYRQHTVSRLISHETRLSQNEGRSGWLIGAGVVSNRVSVEGDSISTLSPSTPSRRLSDIAFEATLFGQLSLGLPLGFVASGGARLAYTRLSAHATNNELSAGIFAVSSMVMSGENRQSDTRLTPSFALSLAPVKNILLFLRYDQGFRPGGLAIGDGGIEQFDGDRLASIEAGARIGGPTTPANLSLVLAHTHWRNVQADLTTYNGLPSTANIGNATLSSLELSGRYRPTQGVHVDASVLVNRSMLRNDAASIIIVTKSSLPDVARFGASAGATWERQFGHSRLTLEGRLRYIGKSSLGVGPVLGVPQGDYLDGEFVVRWAGPDRGIALRLTNPFDNADNRFSLGTPFRLYRPQTTPLRPRTLRLGFDARF